MAAMSPKIETSVPCNERSSCAESAASCLSMTTLKRMVRPAGAVTWLIGIVTCIGLTIWSGPDAVGHAVANVGWGIPLVLAIRAVTISISGLGWWLVFPLHIRPRLATC